jgi:hypothetical protein
VHRDALFLGLLRLAAAHFWAPPAYSAHRRSGQRGPGNAAKGVADLAYYYKWLVGAEFVAFLDVQPTAHIRSLIFRCHARAAEGSSIKSKTS